MGVAYCHMNGIIHRDIKPRRIMIGSAKGKAVMKISGFGSSRYLSATDDDETANFYTLVYSCLE